MLFRASQPASPLCRFSAVKKKQALFDGRRPAGRPSPAARPLPLVLRCKACGLCSARRRCCWRRFLQAFPVRRSAASGQAQSANGRKRAQRRFWRVLASSWCSYIPAPRVACRALIMRNKRQRQRAPACAAGDPRPAGSGQKKTPARIAGGRCFAVYRKRKGPRSRARFYL